MKASAALRHALTPTFSYYITAFRRGESEGIEASIMRMTKWLLAAMTGLLIASCSKDKDEPNVPVGPDEPTTVAVTGVSINKTSVTLLEGNTETVTATVSPEDASDKGVTWKSSDPSVATVDSSGKITAVAPGEAVITVTTKDGEKTATVKIVVTMNEFTAQRAVLKQIYDALDGDNWTHKDGWNTDAPLNEWYGLEVDDDDYVVGINLASNNLAGQLPDAIADLTYLESLVLSDNGITGMIPETWGQPKQSNPESVQTRAEDGLLGGPSVGAIREGMRLTHLLLLNFSNNKLEGAIPGSFFSIASLTEVNLSNNNLSDAIPTAISDMFLLKSFDVSHNNLSGSIPEEIGMLAFLTSINLSFNNISGSIPATVGDLNELVSFNVSNNNLTGGIPATFANLDNLEYLDVSGNELTEPVPVEVQNSKMWENIGDTIDLTQKDGTEIPLEPTTPDDPTVVVTLDKTTLEMEISGVEQLTATVINGSDDTIVTWSSSDENVVKVDENGLVEAVGSGEAVVTATADNVSAQCKVTVSGSVASGNTTDFGGQQGEWDN